MPSEWCTCASETTSGHLSLAPVADVYVHSDCLKPSFAIWQKYEDYCYECGASFSSPTDTECWKCGGRSWAMLVDQFRNFVQLRDAHFYMAQTEIIEKLPGGIDVPT